MVGTRASGSPIAQLELPTTRRSTAAERVVKALTQEIFANVINNLCEDRPPAPLSTMAQQAISLPMMQHLFEAQDCPTLKPDDFGLRFQTFRRKWRKFVTRQKGKYGLISGQTVTTSFADLVLLLESVPDAWVEENVGAIEPFLELHDSDVKRAIAAVWQNGRASRTTTAVLRVKISRP